MPAYKDVAKNTWYISFYFVNWKGDRERKLKRGFPTKRAALEFERDFRDSSFPAWTSGMRLFPSKLPIR